MTKKKRIFLFFIFIIIFLIISPIIVLYSSGYRFDFQTKKITQTGGFYFKVFPKNVQISVTPLNPNFSLKENKRIVKKTDFFFGAVFLKNLLPKKYLVEIQKNGYHSWQKILEVKEKEVTDAKNVTLLPEKPEVSLFEKEIEDMFLSPDEKKIILKTENYSSNQEENNWSLKILDLEKNLKSPLLTREEFLDSKNFLSDLNFSPDSKKLLVKINFPKEEKYFLLDLTKTPSSKKEINFLEKEIDNLFFHPENNEKFFLLKEKTIFEKDLNNKEKPKKLAENVLALEISNKDVYFLEKTGFLFKTDLSFSNKEKLNKDPLVLKEDFQYKIFIIFDKVFLQDNENLYLLNQETKNFEKFLEGIKNYKIAPDFKKVSFWSNKEIWVFFLKEDLLSQPQRRPGEKLFIARFSKPIKDLFWLNNHYLIFTVEDKIKVSEIDERDKINMVDLFNYKEPKIFWIKSLKKLYILSEKNFFISTIPTL